MTVDERMDRLTERHEALAQSLELLEADLETRRRNVDTTAESIRDLVQVARIHETRILHLQEPS